MLIYIFDIDGTICHARQKMDYNFAEYFYDFTKINNVVFVTGSNLELIQEQIPQKILNNIKLYTCSGVEGLSFEIDYHIDDPELIQELENELMKVNFTKKTGNHIVPRKGMINFSIPGRNASKEERLHFENFDKETNERKQIADRLISKFGDVYDIFLGGATSIDITKKGINKSLVAKDLILLYDNPMLIFFGDGILNHGNDYPLAKYINDNNLGYSVNIEYSLLYNNYERILF